LGRANGIRAVRLAPVRCTPPRRRLQSTVRDGRSPGSRVAAWSPPSRGIPSGTGEGSSLTVAGAAPALKTLAPASLFTFHAEGPSLRTLAAGVAVVNLLATVRSGNPTKMTLMPSESRLPWRPSAIAPLNLKPLWSAIPA